MNKDYANSKVIIFTDLFPPLDDATSILNQQICNYLSKKREITVVVSKSFFSNEKFISNPKKNLYIRRIPLPFLKTRYIFLKIFKFSSYCLLISIYLLLKRSKNNIYIIHTSPPFLIPYFAFLSKIKYSIFKRSTKLILIAHDLYPNILLHFKGFSSSKFIYNNLKKLFLFSYVEYKGIISCCDSIKYLLINEYGFNSTKIATIPCWSLVPREVLEKFKKPLLEKKFYKFPKLILMGNVGVLHLVKDVKNLISILVSYKKINTKVEFYIRGSKSKWLINNLLDKSHIRNFRNIPCRDLVKVYSEPSITLVPLERNASLCAFPSRITTSLSLGAPILLLTDFLAKNPLVKFVEKHQIGIAVEVNLSSLELIEKYKELINNYNYYSKNATNCYCKIFNEEKCLDRINNFLEIYY